MNASELRDKALLYKDELATLRRTLIELVRRGGKTKMSQLLQQALHNVKQGREGSLLKNVIELYAKGAVDKNSLLVIQCDIMVKRLMDKSIRVSTPACLSSFLQLRNFASSLSPPSLPLSRLVAQNVPKSLVYLYNHLRQTGGERSLKFLMKNSLHLDVENLRKRASKLKVWRAFSTALVYYACFCLAHCQFILCIPFTEKCWRANEAWDEHSSSTSHQTADGRHGVRWLLQSLLGWIFSST